MVYLVVSNNKIEELFLCPLARYISFSSPTFQPIIILFAPSWMSHGSEQNRTERHGLLRAQFNDDDDC